MWSTLAASTTPNPNSTPHARLCALNSRYFDFGGSVFSQRNMYRKDKRDGLSKQGAGRVRTLSIQLVYCTLTVLLLYSKQGAGRVRTLSIQLVYDTLSVLYSYCTLTVL